MIHGWGGSKASLEGLNLAIRKLDKEAKITNIELPGFGSTKLEKIFTIDDYMDFVVGEIDLHLDKGSELILVGHSFGGNLLMRILSSGKYADSKLVLINSSGLNPGRSAKRMIFKLITLPYQPVKYLLHSLKMDRLEEFVRKIFYKYVVGARDYQKASTNPLLKETFNNVVSDYIADSQIQKIQQKTLVLWAADDKDTPHWIGQKLHDLVPNSELVTIENTTHGLPLHQPELVAQIIYDFVENEI